MKKPSKFPFSKIDLQLLYLQIIYESYLPTPSYLLELGKPDSNVQLSTGPFGKLINSTCAFNAPI